jgi:hypothetical protein
MNSIRRALKVWELVTFAALAAIIIPLGIALLFAAAWLLRRAGNYWFVDALATFPAWFGASAILGSLALFAWQPKDKLHAAPNTPARPGCRR